VFIGQWDLSTRRCRPLSFLMRIKGPQLFLHAKAMGVWKERVIVPQGASNHFVKIGEVQLQGHPTFLDTYFCAPQKSMQAFDRMKSKDMYPGVWTEQEWTGQIFLGHLADTYPGKVRTVKNPEISWPGVVSGDLDHPIFSLVCNPATRIHNWAEVIWDNTSPWGQNGNARHTRWARHSANT
jgi:hypothetical protein